MSYANSEISMKNGDLHSCCEYPTAVLEEQREAKAEDRLMSLESPTIPAGQRFYLNPHEVSSIKKERYS